MKIPLESVLKGMLTLIPLLLYWPISYHVVLEWLGTNPPMFLHNVKQSLTTSFCKCFVLSSVHSATGNDLSRINLLHCVKY